MGSSPQTIKNVKIARSMKSKGKGKSEIAQKLDVSELRIDEYLERNDHPLSCQVCEGYGVNKQRSTGIKKAICR